MYIARILLNHTSKIILKYQVSSMYKFPKAIRIQEFQSSRRKTRLKMPTTAS